MELIKKYFPHLSAQQVTQFTILESLYRHWNAKINVISRRDIEYLCERHILHSLSIAKIIQFKANTKVLDVGTGGGFPGIPLAIIFPNVHFRLIDSVGKKIKVVSSIIKELKLRNAEAEQIRAENDKGHYDFVISRAVSALPVFLKLTRRLINPGGNNIIANGIIYIKGGEFLAEFSKIRCNVKVYKISDFFEEDFFLTKKVVYIKV